MIAAGVEKNSEDIQAHWKKCHVCQLGSGGRGNKGTVYLHKISISVLDHWQIFEYPLGLSVPTSFLTISWKFVLLGVLLIR